MSVSAQIDRKGFCEGEDININAKFENTCSRIVVPKAAIVARHSYSVNGTAKVSEARSELPQNLWGSDARLNSGFLHRFCAKN